MKITKQAFTLVELMVVVTVLAILGTIGFISYSNYLTGVRDTNRSSQLESIGNGLDLFSTKNTLPLPDDYVTIDSGGVDIAYQGYAGSTVLESIGYSKAGKDPKDNSYFTYYLTSDKKYFQLMAFMEEQGSLQTNTIPNIFPTVYAATDYSTRYPSVYGKKLGVLTDANNTPIQELTFTNDKVLLSTTNSGSTYIAHLSDSTTLEDTGLALAGPLRSIKDNGAKFGAPSSCPDGFIPVPGNTEFVQAGFCVAKYEMSYDGATTPNSTVGGTDWNTYAYDSTKTPVSKAGLYPIADISQINAIAQCQKMGNGYHLITNNEWMTIARNIEQQSQNWNGGVVGSSYLYNGVSNNTTYGCNATGGNSEPRTYVTKTGPGDSSCNPKRSHTLSNGEVIWDLSGNVHELVNRSNNEYASTTTEVQGIGDSCGASGLWSVDGNPSTTCAEKYGPVHNAGGTNLGLGNVTNSSETNKVFARGYAGNNGSTAGVYALRLSWSAVSLAKYIGFRCAK